MITREEIANAIAPAQKANNPALKSKGNNHKAERARQYIKAGKSRVFALTTLFGILSPTDARQQDPRYYQSPDGIRPSPYEQWEARWNSFERWLDEVLTEN